MQWISLEDFEGALDKLPTATGEIHERKTLDACAVREACRHCAYALAAKIQTL